MKKFPVPLFLVFLSSTAVWAQDQSLETALKGLLDDALQINIVARMLPPNDMKISQLDSSMQLTIPGRSVAVSFVGENIIINASLTPYLLNNGNLVLVTQGQVWFSDPVAEDTAENVVEYLSSFQSIPVTLGEKIFFFPLGIPDDMTSSQSFNIALEIQIVPFSSE